MKARSHQAWMVSTLMDPTQTRECKDDSTSEWKYESGVGDQALDHTPVWDSTQVSGPQLGFG